MVPRPMTARNVLTMRTTRLRVTMSEVEPAVVRVLDVPAGVLLPELHDILQVAIGWTDSHLHQFVADGVTLRDAGHRRLRR